jgi:phage terminase large subunit
MKLLPKQENAVYYLNDKVTEEILYGGAAGGGKTALDCLHLIEKCQKYKGSRWLMGRSKLKTLKETTLNTFFELSSKLNLGSQFKFNAQENVIHWKNGSDILLKDLFLYPSDPNFDSLGSLELTGAVIDECNQVNYKAWQIVKSRIRYKLKEFDLMPKMLGTCNPSKNWTYSNFYKPFKDGTLPEYRKFIQALPTDNPHLHPSYIQSLLRLDKNSKERLYYGNWEYDDDPSALMTIDSINNIFTNQFVQKGNRYISCDVARFGSDKTAIAVWEGLRIIKLNVLVKKPTTWVAQEINELRMKYSVPLSNIVIDEDGVGGGVLDQLNLGVNGSKCRGFVNNSSPLMNENFDNLKSQCYFKLAENINLSKVYIENNVMSSEQISDLIEELEQVKQKDMDKDGKKKVVPKDVVKENIGRSPDFSDVLMMRMLFEIMPVKQREIFIG